jgi:hypothetical protein
LVRFKHVDKVYQLDNLHCLDGAYDNLARMDAVDDNLYIAALKMIDREVQGGKSDCHIHGIGVPGYKLTFRSRQDLVPWQYAFDKDAGKYNEAHLA